MRVELRKHEQCGHIPGACGTGTMGNQVPSLVFEGPVESSTKVGWGMSCCCHPQPPRAGFCPWGGVSWVLSPGVQTNPSKILPNHDSSCRKPLCAYSHPSLTTKRKFKFPIQLQDLEPQISYPHSWCPALCWQRPGSSQGFIPAVTRFVLPPASGPSLQGSVNLWRACLHFRSLVHSARGNISAI